MEQIRNRPVITGRKPLQGVVNILDFNRHFYVIGMVILISLFTLNLIIPQFSLLINSIILATILGLCIPLLVSMYVYDFSHYYELNWFPKLLQNTSAIKRMATINAGFDETSHILRQILPNTELFVYDFYDETQHTEPSIKRARAKGLIDASTQSIETSRIPQADQSLDLICFLSSIHEVRDARERVKFLKECKRVLKSNGQMIIVEHTRNFMNSLAFSVGVFHFFSDQTWRSNFQDSGFTVKSSTAFTPFLTIYSLQP